METVRLQIAEARESLDASGRKRGELIGQLRERLAGHGGSDDPARLQTDNPVAFALVRSIDAEDRRQAESRRELADLERQLARLEARRIAMVNGVSLTVVNSKEKSFQVAIIPYTYEVTNFHEFKPGTVVNLEFDVIGKYVVRYLKQMKL